MAMWFLGRMSKPFKTWHVDQIMLLPPSVQDLVPEGHLAHFVRDTVRDSLDLSAIVDTHTEARGFPPMRGRPRTLPSDVPEDRVQRNCPDPESRIMKTADGFVCRGVTRRPPWMPPVRLSSPRR